METRLSGQEQDCTRYDKKCAAFVPPESRSELFTQTIHWSSHKLAEICRGIMTGLLPHRSETHGIAKRADRRAKKQKGLRLCGSNQDGVNTGWKKQLNVIVFYEACTIYVQVRKLFAKEDTTPHSVVEQDLSDRKYLSSKRKKQASSSQLKSPLICWFGFKRFTVLTKSPHEGPVRAGDKLTKIQTSSRADEILPEMLSNRPKHSQREERRQWDTEKPIWTTLLH